MRASEVPQSEIERVRAFVRRVRTDKVEIRDDEMVGPRLMRTSYADFLRLIAWWGVVRAEAEGKKAAES